VCVYIYIYIHTHRCLPRDESQATAGTNPWRREGACLKHDIYIYIYYTFTHTYIYTHRCLPRDESQATAGTNPWRREGACLKRADGGVKRWRSWHSRFLVLRDNVISTYKSNNKQTREMEVFELSRYACMHACMYVCVCVCVVLRDNVISTYKSNNKQTREVEVFELSRYACMYVCVCVCVCVRCCGIMSFQRRNQIINRHVRWRCLSFPGMHACMHACMYVCMYVCVCGVAG
jgi:hypothetical protein